jgi:hypothetical protein
VAEPNDQTPEFDELNLFGSQPDFSQAADFTSPADAEAGATPSSGEMPVDFTTGAGAPHETTPTAEAETFVADAADMAGVSEMVAHTDDAAEVPAEELPEKKASNLLFYFEWVGLALVATAIVVGFSLVAEKYSWWHAGYWILLAMVPWILWKTRKAWSTPEVTAPYTVMLGIGAMALLTGVYFLGLELAQYDWDLKAKNKPTQTVAMPVEPPASNIPGPSVPDPKLPVAKPPEAKLPEAKLPAAATPEAKLPEAKLPEAKTPEATLPAAKTPAAATPEAKTGTP